MSEPKTVSDLAEEVTIYVTQLQAENKELRRLVEDFDKCLTEAVRLAYIQGHATIYDGTLLDSLHPRMQELGMYMADQEPMGGRMSIKGKLTRIYLWIGEALGLTHYRNCHNCGHCDKASEPALVWCDLYLQDHGCLAATDPCEAVWCDSFKDRRKA